MPKKDSRLLLAKFNDQMEKLYELLRAVEDIRLAPEVARQYTGKVFTRPCLSPTALQLLYGLSENLECWLFELPCHVFLSPRCLSLILWTLPQLVLEEQMRARAKDQAMAIQMMLAGAGRQGAETSCIYPSLTS